jgi:hypothetical protein
MADTKLADLTALTAPSGDDLLYVVDDPAGTPADRKLALDNLFTRGTITADSPIINAAQTWNNAAVTFTGIKLNVTDTASAAASNLMDLQVGGVSQFSVSKAGAAFVPAGTVSAPSLAIRSKSAGFYGPSANTIAATIASSAQYVQFSNLFRMTSAMSLGWSSGDPIATNLDVILARDAANTLAQRNGVNAQAFNIYNTFTDASNYERGFMRWVSNVLRIGTEKLGTGAARALEFQTDGTTRLTIATDGVSTFGAQVNATIFNSSAIGSGFRAASGGYFFWASRANLDSPSDGVIRMTQASTAGFDRLQFGGSTSSFPALKRSTTSLQARLADDSAFTNIQGKLTTETAYAAGAPTATGYIVLYDSTGTAYKVPAEAL